MVSKPQHITPEREKVPDAFPIMPHKIFSDQQCPVHIQSIAHCAKFEHRLRIWYHNAMKSKGTKLGKLQQEIRERTLGYVIAAFGLVAGLAWNDAVKALIEYLFPLQESTLSAKIIYAILITLVVVVCTMYLNHLFQKDEQSND